VREYAADYFCQVLAPADETASNNVDKKIKAVTEFALCDVCYRSRLSMLVGYLAVAAHVQS
jgi:hypothetical protein